MPSERNRGRDYLTLGLAARVWQSPRNECVFAGELACKPPKHFMPQHAKCNPEAEWAATNRSLGNKEEIGESCYEY